MRNYCFYFLAVLSLVFPFSVSAVEVAPSGYHVTVEPGQTEIFAFSIRNTSAVSVIYNVSIRDGQDVDVVSPIAEWFAVEETIDLALSEAKSLTLTARIPQTATPGDRYIYVLLTQQTQDAAVRVQPEIGVPVRITVAGEIDEALQVRSLTLDTTDATVRGTATIRNIGNIAVPLSGELRVNTKRGVVADTSFSTLVERDEMYHADIVTQLSPWYVGPVLVQMSAQYGILNEQMSETTRQYVVGNYVRIAGIGGLLMIMISVIFVIRKKHRYVS